jgi:UDP-N-acetylmuramyl pentapeptide phosphotransferase/UDP-N-acetylglucosamine-1-phosphate transferase
MVFSSCFFSRGVIKVKLEFSMCVKVSAVFTCIMCYRIVNLFSQSQVSRRLWIWETALCVCGLWTQYKD